jgi:hypothetical protein
MWFLKNKNTFTHPVHNGIYAILKGTYSGQYIVFMEKNNENYNFLTLPDKGLLVVPVKSFDNGIENKIIDFIEKLPVKVFKVVESQYKRLNITDGHGRAKKDNKPDKRHASTA